MTKTIAILTAVIAYLLLPVAMVVIAFDVAKEFVGECVQEIL